MTRLGSLPEPVLDVLRAMAVVGRPVSQELLVAHTGAPEDEKTASVHVSNILRKLAVANRAEAAGLALRKGLVS